MLRRQQLLRVVLFGFALIAFALLLVLFSGLSIRSSNQPSSPFNNISLGETGKLWHRNQRVWVTRLSAEQQSALGPENQCAEMEFCALAAASSRAGIELIYSRTRPPQVQQSIDWQGGYVDPANGAVFDLSGRAITPATAIDRPIVQP